MKVKPISVATIFSTCVTSWQDMADKVEIQMGLKKDQEGLCHHILN